MDKGSQAGDVEKYMGNAAFLSQVWQYLKYSACYEEKKIPMADGDNLRLFPGQLLTSLRNISSSIVWYERGIRKEPNPKTVQNVLDWLEKQDMITIDHGRSGKQESGIKSALKILFLQPQIMQLTAG